MRITRLFRAGLAGAVGIAIAALAPVALEAANGSLKVTSFPSGAEVWVDGANTGKVTPMSVSLAEGDHQVPGADPELGLGAQHAHGDPRPGQQRPERHAAAAADDGPAGAAGTQGRQGGRGSARAAGTEGRHGICRSAGIPGSSGAARTRGAAGRDGAGGTSRTPGTGRADWRDRTGGPCRSDRTAGAAGTTGAPGNSRTARTVRAASAADALRGHIRPAARSGGADSPDVVRRLRRQDPWPRVPRTATSRRTVCRPTCSNG